MTEGGCRWQVTKYKLPLPPNLFSHYFLNLWMCGTGFTSSLPFRRITVKQSRTDHHMSMSIWSPTRLKDSPSIHTAFQPTFNVVVENLPSLFHSKSHDLLFVILLFCLFNHSRSDPCNLLYYIWAPDLVPRISGVQTFAYFLSFFFRFLSFISSFQFPSYFVLGFY